MIEKSITLGETWEVRYVGKLAGEVVTIDETWSAAFRVSAVKIGGPTVADVPVNIVDGKFVVTIDTSLAPWREQAYYYDIRITPPGGTPRWHGATRLELTPKNSPAS